MNDSVDTKSQVHKPSGLAIYKVRDGANVWPWSDSVDNTTRILDGERAVFLDRQRGGMVLVSIGGRERLVTKAAWRKLPVWEGLPGG